MTIERENLNILAYSIRMVLIVFSQTKIHFNQGPPIVYLFLIRLYVLTAFITQEDISDAAHINNENDFVLETMTNMLATWLIYLCFFSGSSLP